ncbi:MULTISPECIES: hypothetical protein [unclassified Microcoleus]|uniref:hypothetical protein n=1 Tax=unclassified Microcoleus TaxID=2642155 RepID=UPI002FD46CF4
MMLEGSLNNIHAFIYLIKNQPHLFLIENRDEDLKQASANFGETEDDIAENILEWCEKYPDIEKALSLTRQGLDSGEIQLTNRLPGTTEPIAPPPPPPPKVSRETLLNAIQESFPNKST